MAASRRMFSLQQSLPRLPVPPLQQTLDRFLEAVRPLYGDEDYKHAQQVTMANYLVTPNKYLEESVSDAPPIIDKCIP